MKKSVLIFLCLLILSVFGSCGDDTTNTLTITPHDTNYSEFTSDGVMIELKFYFVNDEVTESRLFLIYPDEKSALKGFEESEDKSKITRQENILSYSLDIDEYKGISMDDLIKIYENEGYGIKID